MSLSLIKMWISFAGIILMFLAVGLILLSRHKLKGVFSVITAVIAYLCMIVGGIIIMYIVLSGPTP
ncbi:MULTISPECIES: DUF2768 domain-containing protein [Salimicrobium]|uniref:DUF2768 domain-containing protein n=4 Tax=Salimicrobium TaxID=351195 RepID=K2GQD9_9BACI|nr:MULTISPECIES: DUF2768 domain-containing protein [Salimicrobium]AKG04402.1 hypothetical protein AAV35_006095 [Salimicrobium jeotgali]EKE32594.1 hypothetical protein MJ3_01512 [Salimicrobium jeotgali]MBM7695423.1 hypothetical protein [Salimicrobium jeotgali]PBB05470.1 DUF2768 domain-containing protein [Salimicrobium humidisoli]SDX71626.1 Protein of unknown function [Salimicrobium album]